MTEKAVAAPVLHIQEGMAIWNSQIDGFWLDFEVKEGYKEGYYAPSTYSKYHMSLMFLISHVNFKK